MIGDIDEDGVATIYDVVELVNLISGQEPIPDALFPFADVDQDGFISDSDAAALADIVLGRSSLAAMPLSVVRTASPGRGEGGVAVTRETIITLSVPLSEESANAISDADFFATFAGSKLGGRIDVSTSRRKITLFYDDPLPPSARIRVVFDGDNLTDNTGRILDPDGDGEAGGQLAFDFDTLSLTFVPGTAVCGRIFSSELTVSEGGTQSVNLPLEGVTITVDGLEDTLFTVTDSFGDFRLDDAPAGRFFVHVDGRTALVGVPEGAYYPFVGKTWESVPGEEVNVGEVFLPLITDGTLQPVSQSEDTVIGLPQSVVDEFPEFAEVAITVPAGALFNDDGSPGGAVGIAPVPPDRLPGTLPEGLDFSLVITVQTDGATNFDEPVPVCFPNTDNLPPGTRTALWSFNHDTGEWEISGPMTVSADGKLVCSDPGVGILAPGWHGTIVGVVVVDGEMYFIFDDGRTRPATEVAQECTRNGCPCAATCKTGASVLLHSGEEMFSRTDLVIPGRAGMDFVMERTYRSRLDYDGPLGHGWNFEFNDGLFFEENGDVVRYNGYSHEGIWSRNPDGSYAAPDGYFSTLERRGDGSFVLTESNGLRRFYRSDGRLFCWEDRYGNRMLFDYDALGDLSTVIDVYGREIDFTFTEQPDGVRRLTRITDFTGRRILYDYDNDGNLISVTGPVINGTPTDNDFPTGRTERYTYSSGFANESLNHNLLSFTAPEEVARSGPPSLSWTYGTDESNPMTFDRVLTETEGGTNASGVAAGGTISFAYEMLNQDEPAGQPDLPRGKASFTDRAGNYKEFFVNEFQQHIITREFTGGLREGEPEFFETISRYDADSQLVERIFPEGNRVQYTYDSSGDRRASGNLLEMREIAGPRGGGNDRVTTYTYEPLYNQVASITDPRGNDPAYTPPVGSGSAERYTKRFFFDYQESTDPIPLAELLGFDLSGVSRGLGDLNADGRTDQVFGNIIRIESPAVELLPGSVEATRRQSTTQPVVTQRAWNDHGQMITEIDPEGNVLQLTFHPENDPDGDGQTHFTPFVALSTEPNGYLATVTQDAALSARRSADADPAALTTAYRYDPAGNITHATDPRGITDRFLFNAANELIAVWQGADVTAAVASGALLSEMEPFAYQTTFRYDFNGRVIEVREENRDAATPEIGAFFERRYVYDILGNIVEMRHEIDADTVATTHYRYDGNENRTQVIQPEGNVEVTVYDERDLPYSVTRGAGTPEESLLTFSYDGNRNPVTITDAADNDEVGGPESITYAYDGFDRLIRVTDPLGGESTHGYDPASNRVSLEFVGHPPGDPAGTPVSLSQKQFDYDELNRVIARREALFIPGGYTPVRPADLRDGDSDGFVTVRFEYDALSRPTAVIEDDGEATVNVYDGVGRVIVIRDALGNEQRFGYDGNGNVTTRQSVEMPPVGSLLPEQTFTTTYVYDQLDRLVRVSDNAGQTTYYSYDSRSNLLERADAEGPLINDPLTLLAAGINAPGNLTRFTYDGLNRVRLVDYPLTATGSGGDPLDLLNPANADGQVSIHYDYDQNSRMTAMVDDRGNRTQYAYDPLDRVISRTYPDGSVRTRQYDADSNLVREVDPNGTVIDFSYDGLNRLIATAVTPAAGVGGTSGERFEYDGFSRQSAHTDRVADGDERTVSRVYDSLSRPIEESQQGGVVSTVWSGDGNPERLIHPSGRTVNAAYDALDRLIRLEEGPLVLFETAYAGPGQREVERRFGNQTSTTYLSPSGDSLAGYDSVNRVTALRHLDGSGGGTLLDFAYTYNRASFQTSEARLHDGGLTDQFAYDSLYRLDRAEYDTVGVAPLLMLTSAFTYDGAGNRVSQADVRDGVPSQRDFTANALNQYTVVDGVSYQHDANGNRISDGEFDYLYDFRNRLVEVRPSGSSNPVARYRYYADGRRAGKAVGPSETQYYYSGWQVLEERDGAGNPTVSYLYGPDGLDDPVQVVRTANHSAGAGTGYYHRNARGDVVAVTGVSGTVEAAWRYDAFGLSVGGTAEGDPLLFQGRRYDTETGLYYFRNRYYDPADGRFLQRDPLHDEANLGNLHTYAANSPLSIHDPMGLKSRPRRPQGQTQTRYPGGANEWTYAGHAIDGVNVVTGAVMNAREAGALTGLNWTRTLANANPQSAALAGRVSENFQRFNNAARNTRIAQGLGTAVSGLTSAAGEAMTDLNTTTSGTVARSAAVGASNAALTYTPHGALVSAGSTIIDMGADAVGIPPPKAVEVFNNTGRTVGVLADFVSDAISPATDCNGRPIRNRGWDSMRKLVNHMKNDQGSISRGLATAGEAMGEPLGDLYNWLSGESARGAALERQRQALLRNR